jgi:hypothetical protein
MRDCEWQESSRPLNERQSRTMSFVEAATNVVVGFAFALVTQFAVFPMLGLAVSVTNNLILGCIFTTVSMVRSFTLRRMFEALRMRSLAAQAGGERP